MVSAFVNMDAAEWRSISWSTLRGMLPDALLYSAWALVVGAPLIGVSVVSTLRKKNDAHPLFASSQLPLIARYLGQSFVAVVAPFVSVSAIFFMAAWGTDRDALTFVLTSHAVLAAAALSLVAFGGLCAAVCADVLDAAACAVCVVLVATAGVLVAGAAVADAPRVLVDAALTASPIVTIASAANVDVVRMDVLYQISPLSHIGFEYPAWYSACGWYLFAASACLIGTSLKMRATSGLQVI
jgi:hypothetical protein